MESFTLVFCRLADCMHYRPDDRDPGRCRCVHPDKPFHLKEATCPLYKAEWKSKVEGYAPHRRKRLEQDF